MQLVEECYNCILKRSKGILDRNNIDLELQEKIQKNIRNINNTLIPSDSWLSNESNRICPAQLGSNRQQILEVNQLGDTFQKEKILGNSIGKYFWNTFKNKSMDLDVALLYSLFGNGIEFDVGGDYTTSITKDKMNNELPFFLKNPKLKEDAKKIALNISTSLNKGDLVLFSLDNVGEHYFDALLIQNLLDLDYNVEIIVKGKPVLNDVTVFDIEEFPLDLKIWDTGNSDVGLFLNHISNDLMNRIKQAKILFIKGMAQFETLSSETLPIDAVYMMKVKCDPVAKTVDSQLGNFIIHYQNKNRSWM